MKARDYVAEVRRYRDCIGNLVWASPMDWMTEQEVLKKTGLTVAHHQMWTLLNFVSLLNEAPDLPWVPVLQGLSWGDYMRHTDMYRDSGVDLKAFPVVGVGTMCRRQGTTTPNAVLATLHSMGLKSHAYGYKLKGLALAHPHLESSDSLAWSYAARKRPPLEGCGHAHCNNCLRYALLWRKKVMKLLGRDDPPEPETAEQKLLF
jgi:hypothetical protein